MTELAAKSTVEALAKQFNVTAEYLVPKMQEYKITMCLLGFWVSVLFIIVIFFSLMFFVVMPILNEVDSDWSDRVAMFFVMAVAESIPVFVAVYNAVEYVGWKHAPEMKLIEYVLLLID
jgi:hypothetical protein